MFFKKVYKVMKGTKATGTRKGMYILAQYQAPDEYLQDRHVSTVAVGRISRKYDPTSGNREVFEVDGDFAWSFEEAPQGWGEYAYTHGGPIFRKRCAIAHWLWQKGWPQKFESGGVVLEEADGEEKERVLKAWENARTPY